MSYQGFAIRKDDTLFQRNISSKSKLSESVPLEYSSSYYKAFIKFLKTTILMEDIYGDFSEFDENLLEFCQNDCYEHDHFTGFFDEI